MSKSSSNHESAEQHVKSIRRTTCKQYSAEEKIRIVIEGLRGEQSIAELCGREPIAQSVCTTSGRRGFWKPGRDVCRVIRPVGPQPMR